MVAAQWWELLLEAVSGKEVLPNMVQAEIQEAEQLKLVSMERKRQADARDQQHCEAKKEWTAANEVYGWDHLKTQLAALRLAELEEPQTAQWLLQQALPRLEASLGLHEETLKALRLFALLMPELTLLRRWRRATEVLRGPNHIDTIEANWHLAIQLHRAGQFQEAIDLFASIASRSPELRIHALLKEAAALQDVGSPGRAELIARQAIRALEPEDKAILAAARQFLGESLLMQHGESVWNAGSRYQLKEDLSLLLEAEELFRQSQSMKPTRRSTLGLVQTLLQLALFSDFDARMLEVETLLREDLSKKHPDDAVDVDVFASQCHLAFCLQLQGSNKEAKAIYDTVLPAYCSWAEKSSTSKASPLSIGASTTGAASAVYNSACLDGNIGKFRWALRAARADRRLSACIATRLLQQLVVAGPGMEEDVQQLIDEFQLSKEDLLPREESFLVLWPQLPSSRSKWQHPARTQQRKGVCCCGKVRCEASKCIAVGH